jgi:hypothetical protein
MTAPEVRPDDVARERPGPYAALAAKARATSDGTLVAAAAGGALYLALLLVVRPAWWTFVVAPLALGAFALWGIAERELGRPGGVPRRRILRLAQVVAVVLGTAAVLLSALRVLGALVGTVIS